MQIEPTDQHRWLHQMLGEWTYEASCDSVAGEPPITWSGRESVKKLGELWVIGEAEGEMPGLEGLMTYQLTLGYDATRSRFVGSFAASASDFMYAYSGSLDDTNGILTLDTDGPSFEDPTKLSKYQDVVEFMGADTRTLTSKMLSDDGTWTPFMKAVYRRG